MNYSLLGTTKPAEAGSEVAAGADLRLGLSRSVSAGLVGPSAAMCASACAIASLNYPPDNTIAPTMNTVQDALAWALKRIETSLDTGDNFDRATAILAASKSGGDPIAEFAALLPGTYYMDPPDGGSVDVLEQFRRMAEDAQKWREAQATDLVATAKRAAYNEAARLAVKSTEQFGPASVQCLLGQAIGTCIQALGMGRKA